MKKLLYIFIILFMLISTTSITAIKSRGVALPITEEEFPDDIFRDYVKSFDLDDSDYLSIDEVNNVSYIEITDQRVTSLEGIQHFYNLNSLYIGVPDADFAYFRNITNIDLSKNKNLQYLKLSELCNLKNLNLSNNLELKSLDLLSCDKLSELNLNCNTLLTDLIIQSCAKLKMLDLRNNKNLEHLRIRYCDALKSIDISNNKLLKDMSDCGLNSNLSSWNVYKPTVCVITDGDVCTLKWDKCAYVDHYQIYKASSKSGTYKKVATTTGTSKTFKRTSTAFYKVRIVYYRPSGYVGVQTYGKFSSVKKVSKYVIPSKPTLKVTTDGSKCMLKWAKCTNAQGYQIYKASSKSGTYKKVATTTSTSKTYERSSTSYYKVRSYRNNEDGITYSKFSNIEKVSKYVSPSQPTLNENPTYNSTQYTIKWSKCSNVDGYQIYRSTKPDSSYKKVATTTGTSKSFKITNKGVYYYKVRSYRKNGNENVYSKFSKPILVLNY